MAKQIFVNLPIKDVDKAIAFFTKLGFTFNSQFTNEKAACLIIEENIFVMLLVEDFFQTVTKKTIADTSKTTEVIVAISAESRAKVDETIAHAIQAGGSEPRESQDHGWMYVRTFQDLDGHLWEVLYADMNTLNQE